MSSGVTKRDFPRLRRAAWWFSEIFWLAYILIFAILLWVVTP